MLGILIQEYFTIQVFDNPVYLVFLFIFILLHLAFIAQAKKRFYAIYMHGITVFIFFFFFGFFLLATQKKFDMPKGLSPGITASLSGVVYDYPVIQKESTRAMIRLDGKVDSGQTKKVHGKLVAFIKNTDNMRLLKPGDRLIFHSRLYKIMNAGNPEEFDFQKYFYRKGIQYMTFIDSSDYVVAGKGCSLCLRRKAFEIRMALAAILESHLEDENAPVAQAMVLGLRDSVTNEVEDGFAAAGIMHILAISGLHVGILFLVLTNLWHWVTFAKANRIGKAFFVILGIWSYAFLTGFPPSVVRATLMLSLFLIGDALGRDYLAVNSVLMAALVLLLIQPGLLFDISFQLSFTAVLGILVLYPRLVRLLHPQYPFIKYFWQIVCVSLSAQIGTLPVSLYYFKLFPTLFLFANLLAIPAAFLIVMGSLAMFFSSWYPLVCSFIGTIVNFCIEILIKAGSFIDTMVFSKIENIHLSLTQSMLLYILFIFMMAFIAFKRISYLKAVILILLFFFLIYLEPHLKTSQDRLLLNYDPQLVFVSHKTKQVIIFSADSIRKQESEELEYLHSYYPNYSKEYHDMPQHQYTVLRINSKEEKENNITLVNRKINKTSGDKLYTERIIIMGQQPPPLKKILQYIEFDQVVFHPTVPYYYIEKQKVVCDEMKLAYHDLFFDGAYGF